LTTVVLSFSLHAPPPSVTSPLSLHDALPILPTSSSAGPSEEDSDGLDPSGSVDSSPSGPGPAPVHPASSRTAVAAPAARRASGRRARAAWVMQRSCRDERVVTGEAGHGPGHPRCTTPPPP